MDFAVQELQALAHIYGVENSEESLFPKGCKNLRTCPMVPTNLGTTAVCQKILTRAILIKDIIDVCSHATQGEVVLSSSTTTQEEQWDQKWKPLICGVDKPKLEALLA